MSNMKVSQKLVAAVAACAFLVALVAPAAVSAQTDGSTDESADTTATDRTKRIEAYRQRVTDALSQAEERRIAGLCVAAQAVVGRLQTNLDTVIENRRSRYAVVADKLNELVRKLQAAEVDTTELEAVIAELDALADTVVEAVTEYQTTLTDLAEMDCEADPSGFKAALSAAREQRAEIITSAQGVRSYFVDTIKPLLQTIREQLVASNNQ